MTHVIRNLDTMGCRFGVRDSGFLDISVPLEPHPIQRIAHHSHLKPLNPAPRAVSQPVVSFSVPQTHISTHSSPQ